MGQSGGRARSADHGPPQHDRDGGWPARRGPRAGRASKTTKSAVVPSARLSSRPSHGAGPPGRGAERVLGGEPVGRELQDLLADQAVRQHSAGVGAGVDRAPPPRTPRRSRLAAACVAARSMWSAYAGNLSRPASAYPGSCRAASPSAPGRRRCATIASIRSVDSPVPCSMQSMPDPIRSGSAVLAEHVGGDPGAVRRAPRVIAASSDSPGHNGVRSPASRSIQSPTSLTQPSPRCASWATYVAQLRRARSRGRSCGCSAGGGRCAGRRGSAAAGRRARGSTTVSAADPQSRSSRAPASRSASACCSCTSSGTAPFSSRPTWQCASTRPGTIQPSATSSADGDRLVGDPPVDDVQVADLPVGQHRPAEPQSASCPRPYRCRPVSHVTQGSLGDTDVGRTCSAAT